MSKALPWKLPKDVLSGGQRGRKPIEQSPVVANHVLSSTMNIGGGSRPYPLQPQPDQPGQKPNLLANAAGAISAQQPALGPLPAAAQNISGARKAQQKCRRKFSTVAEVHAAATSVVVAAPDNQMEVEEQPACPKPRRPLVKKSNNDGSELGKEAGDDQQVKIDEDDDQVLTKDDLVQGFMNLRPRNKGRNDHKNGFIDFSLSLSKKEIEEDFLAMTGQKPRQRPTLKRPHAVQKRINKMFPGLDLDLVCPQAYAVEEKETAGKRI